ncbi:putative membrane protein [Wickerhamomyces ciferrii]|uniref:Membrane protein n=1 Tax=Wickerhamomyces ciferrii (strain ATCC 14091 / BCRC 22168 / CBS 111 / JCM 3599 / NBRC 0793 / NRRL Y-1031 F-60-10) TaxID=1206466 RepID=K0KVZ2_WICCF|nr:uncharacterized protein BN7_4870 [Wickerhamomyces ciferrii]CCH45288.1 putative membrane protein [Wickerhamomyces ciferrii]
MKQLILVLFIFLERVIHIMSINENEFKDIAQSTNIELLPLHNRSKQSTPQPHLVKIESSTPQLPLSDRPQFFILVLLYLLQGTPVGLAFGSIPFLLKSQLSYSQVALFSLASYPYSLKLIWSPIVDALFWRNLGRRKSWIIPVQFLSGIVLIYLGTIMDQLILNPEENLSKITMGFFTLVMLCATQDIAVDGWALTILSEQGLSYASTAQTVGINTGYFMSFTVFLALNSSGFCNKYLRSLPQDFGLVSVNSYLQFWGVAYILVTIYVYYKVEEDPRRKDRLTNEGTGLNALREVYHSMFQVLSLPSIKTFIILHLISKIGFLTNESATNLKLLEKGFAREDLAITVLIDFPFEIIFGYYVAKWSTGKNPLTPWLYAYLGRLSAAALAQVVIYLFPSSGQVTKSYFILVILHHLLGSFMSTIQFVSICAFHTQISDPLIGGTYMTLLNTISNLGGQWPKFIILNLIDFFTVKECDSLGENCQTIKDGYYITNWICIGMSLILYSTWIKKKVGYLQNLPKSAWRVKDPQ